MEYELTIGKVLERFKETDSGFLEWIKPLEEPKEEKKGSTMEELKFEFDEIDATARLKIIGQPEPCRLRSLNFRFLVHATKILVYLHTGVYHTTARWINHAFIKEKSLLELFRHMVERRSREGLFFEYALGSFGQPDWIRANTTYLIGGLGSELEDEAERWYRRQSSFYTRVVGFFRCMGRFSCFTVNGDFIGLAAGDQVWAVREHTNRHDPYAVAILHQGGEKIGYLRATIARHVAPLLDEGRILTGEICAVLGQHRHPDERINIRLDFLGSSTETGSSPEDGKALFV